jgi:anti-anti-sigma factor
MTAPVEVRSLSDVAVITVHGSLKLGETTLDELRRYCCDLGRSQVRKAVLDLGDVPVLDSTGIGVLLHGYVSMKNHGGECRLVRPRKLVLEVLRVVGLLNVFRVCSTLEEALDSFGQQAA